MNPPTRVLLNKNFSVNAAQIVGLREAQAHASAQDTPYELWASHSDKASGMLAATPHTLLEPAGLQGESYAQWLLDSCRAHSIEVLWAGKERELLADWNEQFAAAGIKLVVASTRAIQEELEDKAAFLSKWDENILPIPRWQPFSTPSEFEDALAALGSSSKRLCIKPAKGIYASGFRILEETPDLNGFLGGSLYTMSVTAARELLAAPNFPTMLLMEVLEGAERSIDCVAWEGRLIGAVIRRKLGSGQVIEDRPDLMAAAAHIAQRYHLSGIFNFQTKDAVDPDGKAVANMLEINARASGGLRYSMTAGLDFLRLGLDAATGRLDWNNLPQPRSGFQVFEEKTVRVVAGLPTQRQMHSTSLRESSGGGSK